MGLSTVGYSQILNKWIYLSTEAIFTPADAQVSDDCCKGSVHLVLIKFPLYIPDQHEKGYSSGWQGINVINGPWNGGVSQTRGSEGVCRSNIYLHVAIAVSILD